MEENYNIELLLESYVELAISLMHKNMILETHLKANEQIINNLKEQLKLDENIKSENLNEDNIDEKIKENIKNKNQEFVLDMEGNKIER